MSLARWPAVAAHLLGTPRVPFEVSAEHRVRPDLHKLDVSAPDGALLRADRDAPRYLREKRERLADPHTPLALIAPDCDPAGSAAALREAIAMMARAHPELVATGGSGSAGVDFALSGIGLRSDGSGGLRPVALRNDATSVVEEIATLPEPRRLLCALSLSVQEDIALMAITDAGFVAQALSVVFASGWDPAQKIGRPLFEIHAPVAEGGALRAASDRLARAMVEKGPFVRHVWTIADSDALARPPGQAARSDSVEALWFRCERQVTLPLAAHDRSLFLIRVYVAPLAEVACDAHRRGLIASALASMSDEVLAYKGLHRARELIVASWGARGERVAS